MLKDLEIFEDKKQALVLFYKFLKYYGLFHTLYGKNTNKLIRYAGINQFDISHTSKYGGPMFCLQDLFLDLGNFIVPGNTTGVIIKRLQYSQLWRFFILDNIDTLKFKSETAKNSFVRSIRTAIENNGTRSSELVKSFFEKYDIIIKKNSFL
jgi:hypothetical protein